MRENFDIVYSPDDDGWYAIQYPSGRTTDVYSSQVKARQAATDDEWGEE